MRPKVHHRIFKSVFSSWEALCDDAAAFANTLDRGDLISISHSADNSQGVIVVWYWSTAPKES